MIDLLTTNYATYTDLLYNYVTFCFCNQHWAISPANYNLIASEWKYSPWFTRPFPKTTISLIVNSCKLHATDISGSTVEVANRASRDSMKTGIRRKCLISSYFFYFEICLVQQNWIKVKLKGYLGSSNKQKKLADFY